MRSVIPEVWVVYKLKPGGKDGDIKVICDQSEWEAMERSRPGQQILIKEGITNEGEAERLARGTSGDPAPRKRFSR